MAGEIKTLAAAAKASRSLLRYQSAFVADHQAGHACGIR
jgi:hypothetical protein